MSKMDIQPSGETTERKYVPALRTALKPFGRARVLDDLPDDADEVKVMGRLVEMGSGMGTNGEKPEPTLAELRAFVAASRILTGTHSNALRARVERYAFDPQSPHRMIALEALSSVSPAARAIFEREKEGHIENLRKNGSSVIRGCCAGHDS